MPDTFDRLKAALADRYRIEHYAPSPRPYIAPPPPLIYPPHFECLLVSRNGGIRWAGKRIPLSHVLIERYIGLEEMSDGTWDVYFGPVWLGRLLESEGRIIDKHGRPMRQHRV